jgi:hypothetical protein
MRKELKLFAIVAMLFAITGCAAWDSWTIPNDANTQALGYASGKAVGAAVNKFAPKADAKLSLAWSDMMTQNAGGDHIPAEKIMAFWQQSVVLLGQESKDPYGLISDLTALISIYGGMIDAEGKLILSKPIPLAVARMFELGYKSGKSAVKNFNA